MNNFSSVEDINLQFDPYQSFVNIIAELLKPIGLDPYAQYISIIPFLIILYFAYLIVARSLRISFSKAGLPKEATTGVIFIVRLIFFAIALIAGLAVTNLVAGEGVIAFGALTGTAVGLAFSRSLSNLVSGLYVFASRPFRVGDYIKLGSMEGIVRDITLNYTRLMKPDYTMELIPNSDIVESRLTNYRVRADKYLSDLDSRNNSGYFTLARDKLKSLTTGEEVYRYTFDIQIHRTYEVHEIIPRLKEIVEKWKDEFLTAPEMYYSTDDYNGIVYGFAVIVKDPEEIFTNVTDFRAELAKTVHLKEQ